MSYSGGIPSLLIESSNLEAEAADDTLELNLLNSRDITSTPEDAAVKHNVPAASSVSIFFYNLCISASNS